MLKLTDGMLLYHGSYMEVSNILLAKCKDGKDFGKGFYLTSSREQAHRFVPSSVRKFSNVWNDNGKVDFSQGKVSIYRFHANEQLMQYYFDDANLEWLHYVVANRGENAFPELLERYAKYDIIAGKIANDKTARTINTYMDGLLGGEPGTEFADRMAISMLIPERLADQYCFKTELAIATLEFVGSENYDASI